MRRNFKTILTALFILSINISLIAQSEVEYKDVILDGKPAKLNVATGEITLVNTESNKKAKFSKAAEESKTVTIANALDSHVVKEGETLLDVSRKYKVSLTKLKQANNLETTLINKGQRLRVKNFDSQIELASQVDTNSTVESYSENNTSAFHVVKKDETLYSLSKRYNLNVDELKSLNNLNSNLIIVGQKLCVRASGIENEVESISVWTVSKDDTLFSISKKTGTSVQSIKQLNGLTSNLILIGQKLRLN